MISHPSSSDLLAHAAQRAGLALACAFSTSDEFEADIIRARRAAGVYGPKRRRRQVAFAGAMAVLLLVVLIVI